MKIEFLKTKSLRIWFKYFDNCF